jgi:hypothetical protein
METYSKYLMVTDVFLNQGRVNLFEHMVKMTSLILCYLCFSTFLSMWSQVTYFFYQMQISVVYSIVGPQQNSPDNLLLHINIHSKSCQIPCEPCPNVLLC